MIFPHANKAKMSKDVERNFQKCTNEILDWVSHLWKQEGIDAIEEQENWIYFVLHTVFVWFWEEPIRMSADDFVDVGNRNLQTCKYTKNLRQFFHILSSYVFVLHENLSLPEEPVIGPNILSALFENLLGGVHQEQKTIRQGTGSFYTPPIIVTYMIEESLCLYLESKLEMKDRDEGWNKIRQLVQCSSSSKNPFFNNEETTKEIIRHLSVCRILDPSCGTGAFPMGALQKMVKILEILDPQNRVWREIHIPKNDGSKKGNQADPKFWDRENMLMFAFDEQKVHPNFARKFFLIKNCLYGVDIQPLATQVCIWRFWISLLVEIKAPDISYADFLPNVGLKFVTANALVDLAQWNADSLSLEVRQKAIELQRKMQKLYHRGFFVTSDNQREELSREYEEISRHMCIWLSEKEIHLWMEEKWNPFKTCKQKKSSSFLDVRLMFGVDKAFDIVITNPPYIGQKNNNHIFSPVKKSHLGTFHQRRMDYFYFFFHQAIELVRPRGVISFLTTNYYITATYADKLRTDIKERTSIRHMLDFDKLKIFASAGGQHNLITILSKGYSEHSIPIRITQTQRSGMVKSDALLEEILYGRDPQTLYYERLQDVFETENNYIILRPKEGNDPISNILDVMQKKGRVLSDICDITQGIVTGADRLTQKHLNTYSISGNKGKGIFVLSKEEIAKLNLSPPDKSLLVKPWFKNSDISRWTVNQDTKMCLLYCNRSQKQDLSEKIRTHFKPFKPILINRNTRSGTGVITNEIYDRFVQGKHRIDYVMLASVQKKGRYFCVSYARNPRFFESEIPKIVVPQRCSINIFGYTENRFYASTDVYFLISKKDVEVELKYVLALLNSKLYYVWLYIRGKRKGGHLELYQKPLEDIPIFIEADQKTQQYFVDLVDQIIQAQKRDLDIRALECEINKKIYELYGLTEEEISAIEGFVKN